MKQKSKSRTVVEINLFYCVNNKRKAAKLALQTLATHWLQGGGDSEPPCLWSLEHRSRACLGSLVESQHHWTSAPVAVWTGSGYEHPLRRLQMAGGSGSLQNWFLGGLLLEDDPHA